MRSTVAVLGAGPVGAATAYALTRAGVPGVTLVGPDGGGAFRSSGGSVCWHRNDADKAAMIRATADFVRDRVAAGAQIAVRDVPYLFLDAGVLVPALNLSAADLVADLVGLALAGGATRRDVGRITAVREVDGGRQVVGETGTVDAEVVVVALGVGSRALVDGLDDPVEKRQLFVLDLPVDAGRAALPHLVAPVGSGFAYVFVKQTAAGLRVLLGQEDLLADGVPDGPVDHLAELLAAGVEQRFPFLRGARAERVLWGVDWEHKVPRITEHGRGLLSVTCGSAVRACVPIGERAAAAVTAALGAGR